MTTSVRLTMTAYDSEAAVSYVYDYVIRPSAFTLPLRLTLTLRLTSYPT